MHSKIFYGVMTGNHSCKTSFPNYSDDHSSGSIKTPYLVFFFQYAVIVGFVLILQIVAGILGAVFKDQVGK